MSVIQLLRKDVIWYSASHWDRYTCGTESTIQNKILQDLDSGNLSLEDFYNHRCILSFLNEGHDIGDLDAVIEHMDRSHGRSRYAVLVSAQHPSRNTQDPVFCFAESLVNHGNFFDNIKKHPPTAAVKLTKKFLCLIRRASPARAEFASRLLQSDLRHSVTMSFGSHHFPSEVQAYQSLFANDCLPILLDGMVAQDQAMKIYDVQDSWYGALFNCVVETSNQTDPGSFRSKFLTEKTFKAFAMGQIPIWFAVPGLVSLVRRLGFDMFDDIVDHSYDAIQDPNLRMSRVLQQILTLHHRFTLDQCQHIRDALWNRLNHNYNTMIALEQKFCQRLQLFQNNFIDHECKNTFDLW